MSALASHVRFFRIAAGTLLALGAGLGTGAFAQDSVAPAPSAQTIATVIAATTAEAVVARLASGGAKPFEYVIKDTKEMKGFFTLHQRDEKIWIEIRPEQLDQPFFFSFNISNGIGERRLYGSQMGGSHMAVFKKVGNQIQLIAKNTRFTAQPGTPQAIAVAQAFSDSLLASTTIASAPHPTSKAILVEANALRFSDIPGYATQLAYGTDEDAGGNVSDPEVNPFDLGGDPLAYFKKRLALSRELWARLQTRHLKTGESYEGLRRSFDYGFSQFASTVPVAVKYVGGVRFLRDHAGTTRATFTPVPVQHQRLALAMITDSLFAVDSFKFSPELISRLGVDHFDRSSNQDASVANRVLAVQTAALDQLMTDVVASRLLDAQEKVADGKKLLSLAELYDTLQRSVWSELKNGKDIPGMRRNLQREHLKRLANTLLRPGPAMLADARSLQRENAIALQHDIRAAMAKPMGKEAKAHLAESLNTLSEALKATMLRASV